MVRFDKKKLYLCPECENVGFHAVTNRVHRLCVIVLLGNTHFEETEKTVLIAMKKDKIVVIGSSNTDMVIRVDHIPQPGETVMGREFLTNQGGKGANQAVAASSLGQGVVFVARLGDDSFGHDALDTLSTKGLDTRFVTLTPGVATGCAMIAVDDRGENSIIVASGANAALSCADIDAAADVIRQEAAIVLMQLESPIETLTYAARMAHEAGARVVLNPAPFPSTPLPEALLSNIDLIVPNETEAARMTGLSVETEADMLPAIEAIRKKGVHDVIITAGAAGSYTLVNGTLLHQQAFPVKPVDTTAAGDTYCGALCVALRDGLPFATAMRRASAAASLSTTRLGAWASIPSLEEVEAKLNEK